MQPELIIQFGRTVTSKGLDAFINNTSAKRYIVNESGQWFDPYNNAEAIIGLAPAYFCDYLLHNLENIRSTDNTWLESFHTAEDITREIKEDMINKADFPFEGRIISEVISSIPAESLLMISNSMPVRDLDNFASKTTKDIYLFSNRGASGIDGIVSTALGISASSSRPVVLITGDLAFYHDLNGLLAAKKYNIPLTIILINNNGGGIFEMLPVSNENEQVVNDFFITPHNLDFSGFVKGYGGEFYDIPDWNEFQKMFQSVIYTKGLSVLQIRTNAKESTQLRRLFVSRVGKAINDKSIESA
jgi:2-succinyl-5-enolpyruvyl-6-hydroxy-3-cyclohexene-1-carboxylate synthase